ncbi:glycosyltransferase [Microaerobacter geothermalis]|uniref:glycosyltransferase n=1 Tax=Microaerobacter geothermalis TaxID=674972 RepID=UPI001F158013|nr:glycosyltransferase [Microaerobacter geothermalis]
MLTPLKVIHIIGGGEFGGAEQHIIHLLSRFNPQKVQVEVLCFYDSTFAEKLRRNGIKVHVMDQYGRFDFRLLKGITQFLDHEKPDIVHTHGVKANFFGRLACRRLNISPVVTTIHSLLKYDYAHPLARFFASKMELWTRKWTTHFIAISKAIEEDLYETGVSSDKISVIYHGIDISYFSHVKDPQLIRRLADLPSDATVVGAVGRLVPIKGFDVLLKAASLLKKEGFPHMFVLVGSGPEEKNLRKLASELEITDRVRFLGFQQDIPSVLAGIDIFVSPSRTEGLGLAVLEAMAAGKPVVATGVGGVKELIRDKENGVLIPVDDEVALFRALEGLFIHPKIYFQLSIKAKQEVEKRFSVEGMVEQTYQLYVQLAGQKEK